MRRRAPNGTIEVVRGRLGEQLADELVEFWARHGALDEQAARSRLEEVVCVLFDASGAIAGVNSVYAAPLEPIGGRPFWIYRSFLLPDAAESWALMASTAYSVLLAAFDPAARGPIGICYLIDDPAQMREHREAVWLHPTCIYAGYLRDGRQLRLRYFPDGRLLRPRLPDDFPAFLDPAYKVHVFGEQSEVSADAVVELWTRERVLEEEEARRRVGEVLVVATHGDAEPVGVGTVFLQRNEKLGLDLWYFRAFVAGAHRASRVAFGMTLTARAQLERNFIGGHDLRASGIAMEVENEGLKKFLDYGVWRNSDFAFIGENERGDHVRVHWFPGALAPPAPR